MSEIDRSVWTGRVDTADGPKALRWHQKVQSLVPGCPAGVALVGFACDEGVRRNCGRVGAGAGPRAIRAALANLAWHQSHPVHDAGDVFCADDLDAAQTHLGEVVATLLATAQRPLVLGGGHETSWGTFQGIASAFPNATIGILNLDAHFDLRGDVTPSSGTPFAQMARWCESQHRPFRYTCLGIAEPANTEALFERAEQLGVLYRLDSDLLGPDDLLEACLASVDVVHLSLDLDVLPAATMPAVSAPAARGVPLEVIESLLTRILQSGKVCACDVVEFNPSLDPDGRAARVAARLVWHISRHFTEAVS